MKIATVIGARPQFIKAAPVSRAFAQAGINEYLIHTGQHYDPEMSQIFFDELKIPKPNINLNIRSGSQAVQTGRMLAALEKVFLKQDPEVVVVYGDTNSTLAGALAACKLNIPVAHVEAGLRSFNRSMPEEHNRVLTDHCSAYLFCPTQTAVAQLKKESIVKGVHLVGDPMYDAALLFGRIAAERSTILARLGLEKRKYCLATVHRAYNTDSPEQLSEIITGLARIKDPVVFPLHPRTRRMMAHFGITPTANLRVIPPIGYFDMLALEQNARLILTDSGGVQKEAYFFAVPCVTLRPETEWVETVTSGWNVLVGTDPKRIQTASEKAKTPGSNPPRVFGDGHASEKIARILLT